MSQIRNDLLKWANGGDSTNNDRENESKVEIIRDLRHCQYFVIVIIQSGRKFEHHHHHHLALFDISISDIDC